MRNDNLFKLVYGYLCSNKIPVKVPSQSNLDQFGQ